MLLALLLQTALLVSPPPSPAGAVGDGGWLDRPLEPWNGAAGLPRADTGVESLAAIGARCRVSDGSTPSRQALSAAGWLAYDHLDRQLSADDVEVVAGMSAADQACVPTFFQLFVFVGGRFAGTLAPQPMTTGRDGAAGAVRLAGRDAITAEFARFTEGDATCCPTARMTVRYRIDRSGAHPVVIPADVRTTRGR